VFEVKKPEMTNRTFRVPKELIERLCEVAQEKDVSLNALVIQCCEYALKNLPDSRKNNKIKTTPKTTAWSLFL